MMRKIYFFISLFIAFCVGTQAVAAKKYKLDFEGRTSWFYIISDGKYLTWDPTQDVLMLTEFTPSLNSQWTLGRDGRIFNCAAGDKFSIGCKRSVPALVHNGKAVLSSGRISCEIKDNHLYLGVSGDGKLMFGGNSALRFMTQPVEIPPLKAELPDRIAKAWNEELEASRISFDQQWGKDYDLAQFRKPLQFNAPDRNTRLNELVRRAPEIIAKAQEYADEGKRGSWVSMPWYDSYRLVKLDQNLVEYYGGYYVCRPITCYSTKFLSWPGEDYTYGSDHCLRKPISKRTYEISRNRWIIRYEEQVQVNAESSGKGDASVLHPEEVLKRYRYIGYPSPVAETGTYSTTYDLGGISVPARATCSRKYWQTYRVGRPDCPWEQEILGSIRDPFAPWRIKQTMVFEFSINDYLKQFDWVPSELTALFLLDRALELASELGWQGRCIPVAVLKAYNTKLQMFTDKGTPGEIWQSVGNEINQLVSAKQIRKAVMLANACPGSKILKQICEKIFTECKTADELLSAFSEVYAGLYGEPIPAEDFASYAFAGMSWPGFQPMSSEKEQVPSCFSHYIARRDIIFSDYVNVKIKSSTYLKCFHSYLFNLLAYNKKYDTDMLAKVQTCSHRKFLSDVRILLQQVALHDLKKLVAEYSVSGDFDAFVRGLKQLDHIAGSGYIGDMSDYNAMRKEAVAAVSKLIPGRFVPVISDFDSCWLDGISCGTSQMADLLSSLIEVNREYFEGMLLDDTMVQQCQLRIDADKALKETDELQVPQFVEKWGGNNLFADRLKQI